MKELSIEEKARRYDEALEIAKSKIKNDKDHVLYEDDVIEMFPELAESEDEKIRKWLIALIKSNEYGPISNVGEMPCSKLNVIAWLEKQGEQPDANKEYWRGYNEGKQCILDKYAEIEKQGQKPAWSEWDEENLNWFEKFFRAESVFVEGKDIPQDRYLWFKNLKDRVQPKQEWSKEDEMFVHGLIRGLAAKRDIHGHTTFSSDCIDITETINWLKSLKDRVQPQPKQEWSEEDERTYKSITYSFAHNYPLTVQQQEFVKSFKERYTWKPSDEQIRVCKEVYADILSAKGFDLGTVNGELNRLEEELKKLKG